MFVLIQILSEFFNEVMLIAKVNERTRIWKFLFFEEIFDFDWVVECGFSDDTFYFFVVTKSSASFNILEIDIGVICLRESIS